MLKFAANLSMMFPELEPPARFQAARAAGFEAVEFLRPYGTPVADVRQWIDDAGVELILLNSPPGDADAGEKGLAALPGRQGDFRESLDMALEYATGLGAGMIHLMAGVVPDGTSAAACEEVFIDNLKVAAEVANAKGVKLNLMEGDLAEGLRRNWDLISHIQFSSVPGRHEPQYGEVNIPHMFEVIDGLGYTGWVGCEYAPKGDTLDGLSWAEPYGLGPR
jgi:hydroxypyruvate isomerase